jgi:large subunit ribosomal protein L17
MRHRKQAKKLGRSGAHREALVAALVCHLIEEKRIRTTLPKARQVRVLSEKMVTLTRKGTLAARRLAIARLRSPEAVVELITNLVPKFEGRAGGYTRVLKTGRRTGDGADMAIIEWVGIDVPDKRKKKKTEAEKKAEKAAA